jgi:hypothetical protein
VARDHSLHADRVSEAARRLFAAHPFVILGMAFDIGYIAGRKLGEFMNIHAGKRLSGLAAQAVSLVPHTIASPPKPPRPRNRRAGPKS